MAKVAIAQMVSGELLEDNLSVVEQLAKEAFKASAKLLLLPENFAMLDSKALVRLARSEEQNKTIQNFISNLSVQYGLWIIAGSVPLLSPCGEKVFASCLVFNDVGECIERYDKVHLFDVDVSDEHNRYRESDFIEPGEQLVVVATPVGKVGLSICYDLRFPEQYQRLREMGAEVLVVPSAFTYTTGEAHWEVLLRARAIETQCYVLAANQGGQHTKTRQSWGHSLVVDPWGEVLAVKDKPGVGLVMADVDLADLHNRREKMPIMQHRTKVGF
ncbi:MAG: hypothetical protein CMI05_08535 [Oceanospirillaceae bacterium]|nr:hypothetical protein [Oceanospirillaceae bacterium]